MTGPEVSVVIATYNCGQYIGEAIESMLRQTYRPMEVIVVDDGSTDDTGEEVAKFGKRVRYTYQENAGVAAARNRGVTAATGDLIGFQDGDDISDSNRLSSQVKLFVENSQVGCVCTDAWVTDARRRPLRLYSHREEVADVLREAVESGQRTQSGFVFPSSGAMALLVRRCFLLPPTGLFWRRTFLDVGGCDENMPVASDYDLLLRMVQKADIGYVAEPLYYLLRGREGHLTGDEMARHENVIHLLRKCEMSLACSSMSLARQIKLKIAGQHTLMAAILAKDGDLGGARQHLRESLRSAWRPIPLAFFLATCSGPVGRAVAPVFAKKILGK